VAEDAKKKAAAKKPSAKKEAAKAEAKKPAAKKEATKKAAAKKPAAKKEAAKKGAAKKPTAKKAAAKPKAKAAPKGPAERPVVRAKASYVRIAPRKARLVANQVRGLPLEDAMTTLRFSNRGAARDIAKLIDSAAANAENNHDLVADDLMVADITVDEGPTLRRYRPRALGRATRINKRTSHIKVALTPEELD
jgi:ribosomal protein L22